MKLFHSPQDAWHQAFSTGERGKDYAPKAGGGSAAHWQDIETAAALIKGTVEKLPKQQREAGHAFFAPSSSPEQVKAMNRLRDRLFQAYQGSRDDHLMRSYLKTTKVLIMVGAAVEEAQYRACELSQDRHLSHRAVADRMGITSQSFAESWAMGYEHLVKSATDDALAALTEISPLVQKLNSDYRKEAG